MYLPVQSEPVQRTITTQPATYHRQGGTHGKGVSGGYNGQGIEPSGFFDFIDDIGKVAKTVSQVAGAAGPLLGMIP